MTKYANHEAITKLGLDPHPQNNDVVAWVENGVQWVVYGPDDLEGPAAMANWPDGGWCNVRLMRRHYTTVCEV